MKSAFPQTKKHEPFHTANILDSLNIQTKFTTYMELEIPFIVLNTQLAKKINTITQNYIYLNRGLYTYITVIQLKK